MIKLFSEITHQDENIVGGKAFHQASLLQAGFNIPAGIVCTTEAFEALLTQHNLLSIVDHQADQLSPEELHKKIVNCSFPEKLALLLQQKMEQLDQSSPYGWAVRSSAIGEDSHTHSFAGIHDTLLGIAPDQLLEAIIKCWASAFTPQAIGYRREHHLPLNQIRIAVILQPIIMPRVAGVAFTIDPVSGANEIVINAAFGLGELVVSGQLEPDNYAIIKGEHLQLKEARQGSKAQQLIWQDNILTTIDTPMPMRNRFSLSETEVLELATQLQRVEDFYQSPQDIEWAHDGCKLFILQSRAITTTANQPLQDLIWSRTNLREILPELPSPFSNGFMKMTENEFSQHYRASGFQIEHLRPIINIIYGRPYFNFSIFRHVAESTGIPVDSVAQMIGHCEDFNGEFDFKINLRKLISGLPIIISSYRRQKEFTPTLKEVIERTEREIVSFHKFDIDTMPYEHFQQFTEERRPYFLQFLYTSLSLGSAILGKMLTLLKLLHKSVAQPLHFINAQIAVGEKTISTEQGHLLLQLGELARQEKSTREYFLDEDNKFDNYLTPLAGSKFLTAFQDFIKRFGHRAIHETDISQPRFSDDPTYLLHAISNMVKAEKFTSLSELVAQQEEQAKMAWQEAVTALRKQSFFAKIKIALIKRLLKELKALFVLRERVRFEAVRVLAIERATSLRLANRLVKDGHLANREDIFFLEPPEILQALVNHDFVPLKKIVAQRQAQYAFYATLTLPNLLLNSEVPLVVSRTKTTSAKGSQQFTGLAVSPGIIVGEVVVLHSPQEFHKMRPGKILVAPTTDPSWTPLFAVAIGVIVEMGGILSHGSIVAREYGLPTVVNIPGITKLLHDGDKIMIDGTNGTVELIRE